MIRDRENNIQSLYSFCSVKSTFESGSEVVAGMVLKWCHIGKNGYFRPFICLLKKFLKLAQPNNTTREHGSCPKIVKEVGNIKLQSGSREPKSEQGLVTLGRTCYLYRLICLIRKG